MSSQAVPDISKHDFDRALERAMAIERGADCGMGRALRRLKEGRRYWRLGFVHWGDYVRERLGIELRWAQEIEKLDRACEKVPELGKALASGELVMSKVLALFGVVGERTEVGERRRWIERARGLTVRGLRREIGEWKESASAAGGALPEGERPVDPAEIPAGAWIQFRVPDRVADLWHVGVEQVRRLSNSELPVHQCIEYIVADRFSAIGWADDASPPSSAPPLSAPPPCSAPPTDAVSAAPDSVPLSPVRTMSATRQAEPRPLGLPPELDASEDTDPWELDRIVRAIAELKKRVRQRLAELLEAMSEAGGWREQGFTSLEHYAEECLGLHPRRVRRLIRFYRGLGMYPALARGYFAGKLTYLQVLLLLRVVTRRTAADWAAWAAKRSYLATERAVAYAAPYSGSPTTYALPPVGFGARPRIVGLAADPRGVEPELLRACVRFWCPEGLLPFIRAGLRSCQTAGGLPLPDWHCLEILLRGFLDQAADPNLKQRIARYPELERDGWRCTVPTCSERRNLHVHHIEHRGQGGPDVEWNKTTLCAVQHIGQEHGTGAIRVSGRAPDQLTWEIGRRPNGGPPLLRFVGDVKMNDETAHAVNAPTAAPERNQVVALLA